MFSLTYLYSRGIQILGDKIVYGGARCFWILNLVLASCYFSGTYNFEMAPALVGNLWTPAVQCAQCVSRFVRTGV